MLTKLGGHPVKTMDDVHAALGGLRPGQRVEVELRRDGKPLKVAVELGERPGATPAE